MFSVICGTVHKTSEMNTITNIKDGGYIIGLSKEQIDELIEKGRITAKVLVSKNGITETQSISIYLANSWAIEKIESYCERLVTEPTFFSQISSYYSGTNIVMKVEDGFHDIGFTKNAFKDIKEKLPVDGVTIELKNMDRRGSDERIFIYQEETA